MPASVDSKPLTLALSPLDATLTKNREEGVSLDADAFRKNAWISAGLLKTTSPEER